jgi:DNA ligase-1
MTEHFKQTAVAQHGPVFEVEPTVVLEIAFDRLQESRRHKSGYAMRFPPSSGSATTRRSTRSRRSTRCAASMKGS